jgi:hydroxypyruvate isomerase
MQDRNISRRCFIHNTSLAVAGTVVGSLAKESYASETKKPKNISLESIERVVKNGRINQALSKWCYGDIPFEQLCEAAAKMGIKGIDLLPPSPAYPTLKKYGLVCSLVNSHSLGNGISHKQNHEKCIAKLRASIDVASDNGFPNVITFSGNSKGMSDEEGLENSYIAMKQVIGYAEKKKVTIVVEYLNSKVNHKGYMFDNMAWGVELCKRVGSDNLKILYDIYHAQIMEGDIIRTIKKYHQYIGHYHTGGNPGRHEIDDTQELNYPAIMRAIVKTEYKGFVAHEFIPTRDPLTSLAEAVQICDV